MLKWLAKISSFIVHPLFFLVINLYLLICLKPQLFGVSSWQEKKMLLLLVGVYSICIPAISLLMLKFLKVIDSFELNQRHERIFPLIIVLIFYLWLWMNLKQDPSIPREWNWYMLSAVITTSMCLIVNNWFKISLHVAGIASTLLYWFWIKFIFAYDGISYFNLGSEMTKGISLDYFIMIFTVLGAWIATARLIIGKHDIHEIIIGTFVGLISVFIAHQVIF